jgi:hypothetical protein
MARRLVVLLLCQLLLMIIVRALLKLVTLDRDPARAIARCEQTCAADISSMMCGMLLR